MVKSPGNPKSLSAGWQGLLWAREAVRSQRWSRRCPCSQGVRACVHAGVGVLSVQSQEEAVGGLSAAPALSTPSLSLFRGSEYGWTPRRIHLSVTRAGGGYLPPLSCSPPESLRIISRALGSAVCGRDQGKGPGAGFRSGWQDLALLLPSQQTSLRGSKHPFLLRSDGASLSSTQCFEQSLITDPELACKSKYFGFSHPRILKKVKHGLTSYIVSFPSTPPTPTPTPMPSLWGRRSRQA